MAPSTIRSNPRFRTISKAVNDNDDEVCEVRGATAPEDGDDVVHDDAFGEAMILSE